MLSCWLLTTAQGCRNSLLLCLNKFNYTLRFTRSISVENLQVRDTYWHSILIKHFTLLLWINHIHILNASEGNFISCVVKILFVYELQMTLFKLLYWNLENALRKFCSECSNQASNHCKKNPQNIQKTLRHSN